MKVQHFACQFMGASSDDSCTQAQANLDAANFDIIVANKKKYSVVGNGAGNSRVAGMLTTNPALVLCQYFNTTYTWDTGRSPEGLYTHWDSADMSNANKRLTPDSSAPANTEEVRPNSSDAQTWQKTDAQNQLDASDYPNIYFDVCGPAGISSSYNYGVGDHNAHVPIDADTSSAYTWANWNADVRTLVGYLHDNLTYSTSGNSFFVQNSLGSYDKYYDATTPTDITMDGYVQAYICEDWIRSATSNFTTFPSETNWRDKALQMILDVQTAGYYPLLMVKCWGSGTQDQKNQWYKLATATMLLGTNGNAYLAYSEVLGADNMTVWPLQNLVLGNPDSAYSETSAGSHVYHRAFTNGVAHTHVYVNADTASHTVTLPSLISGTWTSKFDQDYSWGDHNYAGSAAVSLAAKSSLIITKA